MNKIKFLKANSITGLQKIQLNGITYKSYKICELPERFGIVDDNGFSYFTDWFNYKGFTYIAE